MGSASRDPDRAGSPLDGPPNPSPGVAPPSPAGLGKDASRPRPGPFPRAREGARAGAASVPREGQILAPIVLKWNARVLSRAGAYAAWRLRKLSVLSLNSPTLS
jgi:hypothetical protein